MQPESLAVLQTLTKGYITHVGMAASGDGAGDQRGPCSTKDEKGANSTSCPRGPKTHTKRREGAFPGESKRLALG